MLGLRGMNRVGSPIGSGRPSAIKGSWGRFVLHFEASFSLFLINIRAPLLSLSVPILSSSSMSFPATGSGPRRQKLQKALPFINFCVIPTLFFSLYPLQQKFETI